ncbi:MAG TPA: polyprenyl synthetase family protein [Verrucomicrobiales bacterium]|nr:polyprenyl synthetase family protein [Verrucomicrobiales bacterium]
MMGAHSNTPPAETGVPSFENSVAWRKIVGPVDGFLQASVARLTEQINQFDPDIREYVTYALTAQGKHLRPALVALSGNATGVVNDGHLSGAVIVEMVHLATLVHDDVMDEARLRRARPTLAARWGNHLAVLVGDCLFAHSLRLAAQFPTPEVCRVVSAATKTVCSGEILQDRHAGDFSLSREDYFKVLGMKTGELFALSAELGALLNGAPAAQRGALRDYGMALGTAYQVYDDCLDLFGTEGEAGKTLGGDLAKGKLTLPVLLLLEKASPVDRKRVEEWLPAWEPSDLPSFREFLDRYQTFSGCSAVLGGLLDQARSALAALTDSPGRRSLLGLTDFLAAQMAGLGETSKVPAA